MGSTLSPTMNYHGYADVEKASCRIKTASSGISRRNDSSLASRSRGTGTDYFA